MRALEVTGRDLVRALSAAIVARPAVDAAVRARAEAIAAHVAVAGGESRVVRRGHGDYVVEATGSTSLLRDPWAEPVVTATVVEPGPPQS
jgi:hypothetical protein